MAEIELDKLIAAQKKQLEDFTKAFGTDLEARLTKSVEGQLSPVAEHIKTVGDALEDLRKRTLALEESVKSRAAGILPGIEDEITKNGSVNLLKAVPGLPTFEKGSRDYSMVREYSMKKRDLSASDDVAGGVLVPLVMLPGFIELAREDVKVWDPGLITTLTGLSGSPVELPKELTAATVYWVGENEAPNKSDVTFGAIRFQPRKAAARVQIGNRLIRQASMNPAQIVQRSIARGFGLEMDRVILRGTGAGNEPRGIANYPGIIPVAIGTNGGDWTFPVSLAQQEALETRFTLRGKLAYIGHPLAINKAKKERIAQFSGQTDGAYVILPMSDANLRDALGFDFRKTTVIPSNLTKGTGVSLSEVYFGNWEDAWAAMWEDITFKASDVTGDATGSALMQDQTWLYAFIEVDVQLARAASFVLTNDAKTL